MKQDGASTDREVKRTGVFRLRFILPVGVLLGGLALAYIHPSLSRWASADLSIELSRLRTGAVTLGDLLRDVAVQGKIIASDRPTLVSPSQGVVTLLVKAGDAVRRDGPMARIDSPELRSTLEQEQSIILSLESELDRLKISNRQTHLQNQQEEALLELKLKAADRAVSRQRDLFEAGLGSSLDFQKAEDEAEVARLELAHSRQKTLLARDTMEFELRTREIELERQKLVVADLARRVFELAVLSPVDGLVARVDVRDKDTVQPNQPLFSVVDLSLFEVEVLIPENYASEIVPETPAAILYEGREYSGAVRSLSPEVEDSQVRAIVAFGETAPAGLKQNQRVTVRIILDSRRQVLKVPRGPFLEGLAGRQVYVVREGMASLRTIEVGAVSVSEVEVVSGLEPGEQIILSDLTRFEGAERILLRQ